MPLPELIRSHLVRLLSSIAIAVTVLAAFDLAWTRIHWRSELRMTRQEIKDEHKQAEGDPLLKSRLRSLGRDRARQRMIASVPDSHADRRKSDTLLGCSALCSGEGFSTGGRGQRTGYYCSQDQGDRGG